jgi:hypothetical protein
MVAPFPESKKGSKALILGVPSRWTLLGLWRRVPLVCVYRGTGALPNGGFIAMTLVCGELPQEAR